MGFLKKLFKSNNSSQEYSINCKELIRFISFAQKVKPLMGRNYGIMVAYSSPDPSNFEYTSGIYAEFKFVYFDNIKFAREFALRYGRSDRMVKIYYDQISKDAGLSQSDWPFAMDEYDFGRMLTNSDELGFTTLIPDETNDDFFTIRIKAGFSGESGNITYNLVEQECRRHFPNLNIKTHGVFRDKFLFTIYI